MRSSARLLERSISCRAKLRDIVPNRLEGRVVGLSGLVVDIDGLSSHVSVGDRLSLATRDGQGIPAEVVGFRDGSHIALYIGDGKILEAPRTGLNVRVRSLGANEDAWGVKLELPGD